MKNSPLMTAVNQCLNFVSLYHAKNKTYLVVQIQIVCTMSLYSQIRTISQSYTVFFSKITLAILKVSQKKRIPIIAFLKLQISQL